jgi:hypothetical protein
MGFIAFGFAFYFGEVQRNFKIAQGFMIGGAVCLLGAVILLGPSLTQYSKDSLDACLNPAQFKITEKVFIKGMDKSFIVAEVKCKSTDTKEREYKIVSDTGLILEVKEEVLNK